MTRRKLKVQKLIPWRIDFAWIRKQLKVLNPTKNEISIFNAFIELPWKVLNLENDMISVEVLLYIVLECSLRVELCIKVNTDLSVKTGRLYVHRGIPQCTGVLVHSLGSNWLPTQVGLCPRAYILACSLTYFCLPARRPSR